MPESCPGLLIHEKMANLMLMCKYPRLKCLLLSLFLVGSVQGIYAQVEASLRLGMPLGKFSSTHTIGFGVDLQPALHVFRLERKSMAFTYNGGVSYYIGNKEKLNGYDYKYPGFTFVHAFAGILCTTGKKFDFRFTAGPALAIYNGDTRFNVGARFDINYFITNTISIGPGIMIMKEFGAAYLYAPFVRVNYAVGK